LPVAAAVEARLIIQVVVVELLVPVAATVALAGLDPVLVLNEQVEVEVPRDIRLLAVLEVLVRLRQDHHQQMGVAEEDLFEEVVIAPGVVVA
jgi:hypothetical protein